MALLILAASFFIIHLKYFRRKPYTFCFPTNWEKSQVILQNELQNKRKDNSEVLTKRNEFWCCALQIIMTIITIVTMAILLLYEKISSEAGLAIISGLSCLAIGKVFSIEKRHSDKE